MLIDILASVVLVAQGAPGMEAVSLSNLEPRPAAAHLSPLQPRIDAAAPNTLVTVEPGTYTGDLFIDKPIRLVGLGRPTLVASGHGSVVIIRAANVVIEGFNIDARVAGSLTRDSSGIHVAAPSVTIRDVRIERAYFGIYLREADDAIVERSVVHGRPGIDPGEQGSGVHVFNTHRYRLIDNQVSDVRDGIYIQSANHGLVRGNTVQRVRYGLHYMYADDNVFEDNRFEDGAAGASLMYSRRLQFRRNRFVRNRGFASVGLLLKDCEDLLAEDNLLADNARGLFLEGSHRNVFRRNIIAASDAAIVLFDSSQDNVFERNVFLANQTPLELVGRRTTTRFSGNYWSEADEPDLDGDGVRDRPYRIANVFDHFRGNLTAAELFATGPAARALAAAERVFPVLALRLVEDPRPLAQLPSLPDVPTRDAAVEHPSAAGLGLATLLVVMGSTIVLRGRRPRPVAA